MVAPGVAGRHHGRRLAVADRLGRPHQGRVLLAADAAGRVLVHGDDLGRRRCTGRPPRVEAVRADEDDGDAELVDRPGGRRRRSRPAPGRRPWRRRRWGASARSGIGQTSMATRLYQPHVPHTTWGSLACRTAGRALRAGSRRAPRRGPAAARLRLRGLLLGDSHRTRVLLAGSREMQPAYRAALTGRAGRDGGAPFRSALSSRLVAQRVERRPAGIARRSTRSRRRLTLRSAPHTGHEPRAVVPAQRGQGQLQGTPPGPAGAGRAARRRTAKRRPPARVDVVQLAHVGDEPPGDGPRQRRQCPSQGAAPRRSTMTPSDRLRARGRR